MRKVFIASSIILSALTIASASAGSNINDLHESLYQEDALNAVENGYMHLDEKGNFNPKKPVSREHLAKILNDYEEFLRSEGLVKSDDSTKKDTSEKESKINIAEHGMSTTAVLRQGTGKGAGVFISEKQILTAYSVVADAEYLRVSITGSDKEYEAKVIEADQWNNLALVELTHGAIDAGGYSFVELADNDSQTGDTVFGFGHPHTLTYSMTEGIISNDKQVIDDISKLQFDGKVQEGYLGGPLLNEEGKLTGIISNIIVDEETDKSSYGVSLATPINIVKEFINEKE